uniref:Transcription elongation factor S-II n=1 Tax=Strigamia maritima TaxID=126957 RepID=T1IM33_STRMM
MSAVEVSKIAKTLDKMVKSDGSGQDQALDLLKTLKDLSITYDVLQKTRIGKSVNALRKSSKDDEVINLAKKLIKSWKKCLPGDSLSSSSTKKPISKTVSLPAAKKVIPVKVSNLQPVVSISAASHDHHTANAVRTKCREMLSVALKWTAMPDGSADPDELAVLIEDCVFKEFKNTDAKYKNCIRSRVSNLKDPKNPGLRENVLLGRISVEKIAVMTTLEMASAEMKKLRERMIKKANNIRKVPIPQAASYGLIKCKKCKSGNCSYTQAQTRSADEPMTTFAFYGCEVQNRIRSRVSNLKDSKNPCLRENVLLGQISPEQIAVMTTLEMASADLKLLRKEISKESIKRHRLPEPVKPSSSHDLVKCKKCKGNNCSYTQAQVGMRLGCTSESMTTFAHCHDCGIRWTSDTESELILSYHIGLIL